MTPQKPFDPVTIAMEAILDRDKRIAHLQNLVWQRDLEIIKLKLRIPDGIINHSK